MLAITLRFRWFETLFLLLLLESEETHEVVLSVRSVRGTFSDLLRWWLNRFVRLLVNEALDFRQDLVDFFSLTDYRLELLLVL